MEKCQGLGACAVRYSDGTININETLSSLESQLYSLQAEEVETAGRIGAAVNAAFDKFMGETLTMPALTNAALNYLEYTPATFAAESAAIGEYVRRLKDVEFKIAKGKGGGVSRLCDAKPKA